MPKFITLLLILFVSLSLFPQDEYIKLPQAKNQKPTYIYDEKIIGSEYLVKSLELSKKEIEENINEISVLKIKSNRELHDFHNLTEFGILFVDFKENIIGKTQMELNKFFGLKEQNEIYIDGYLLENKKYNIALAGVKEIEIVEPDNANGLKSRVLNIWMVAKAERYIENAN